jgi:LysM repeat protein
LASNHGLDQADERGGKKGCQKESCFGSSKTSPEGAACGNRPLEALWRTGKCSRTDRAQLYAEDPRSGIDVTPESGGVTFTFAALVKAKDGVYSDGSERIHRDSENMITNAAYEPIHKRRSLKEDACQSADVFSNTNKSPGLLIFLAYVPVLLAFIAVGVLLWHFQSTTQRDLESVRTSLYSMAVATSKVETKIGELQRLFVESSVSKTLLEYYLDKLSAQITTLHSDLSSSPVGPGSEALGKKAFTVGQPSLYHEVETGDTLYKIARKYGVPVAQLIEANNLTDKDHIHPGQRILITRGDQSKDSGFTK